MCEPPTVHCFLHLYDGDNTKLCSWQNYWKKTEKAVRWNQDEDFECSRSALLPPNKVGWHVFNVFSGNTLTSPSCRPSPLFPGLFFLASLQCCHYPSNHQLSSCTHIDLLTSFPSSITSASFLPLTPVPSFSLPLPVFQSANCHQLLCWVIWLYSVMPATSGLYPVYLSACKCVFSPLKATLLHHLICIWMWVLPPHAAVSIRDKGIHCLHVFLWLSKMKSVGQILDQPESISIRHIQ